MNNVPQLPKGHTSILSPTFKYVPAVATDVAQTFVRVRVRRLQIQPAPFRSNGSESHVASLSFKIDVLEAPWLSGRPPAIGRPSQK